MKHCGKSNESEHIHHLCNICLQQESHSDIECSECRKGLCCAFKLKNIIGSFHPNDDMLFKINGEPTSQSYEHYVRVGFSAIVNIEEALGAAEKGFDDISSCLDVPCGYGRITRELQTRINPQRITACELNEEAVQFCHSEFGVNPLVSNTEFKKINFNRMFDLIWVGSLITHINSIAFLEMLDVLYSVLEDGGILVFTTHGRYSLERLDKYEIPGLYKNQVIKSLRKFGYFFAPYQHSKDYGISICLPEHVLSAINKISGNKLKLLTYKYKGWDNHQDVYAFQRINNEE